MPKVESIVGGKLPRDLAEYILENEKDIKAATLTIFTHSDPNTATHHFAQITTSQLAFTILSMMVCFIAELAGQVDGEDN